VLYIKYIEIYRKLEECYDQIVHPQKRIFIKKVLESTICRICEIKKYLVFYNFRAGSIYVHLDGLLFDLKYDPSVIEIPVPRYFKEDDNIPVDLVFREKVVREGGKKGKKKGGKKKKKGKKKAAEDDAPQKKVWTMNEKEAKIDIVLMKRFDTTEPVEEVAYDPFTLDLEITSAIRLIQKNERGRQGRGRYLDALQKITSAIKTNDIRKRMHNGKMQAPTKQEAEEQSAEIVQCLIRGIVARKTIEKMRQEEMIFLGMQRKPKTEEEKKNDPIITADKT
jgi:IQ and AAA domain-containing protein